MVLLINRLFPQNQEMWNPVSKQIFSPDSPVQSMGSYATSSVAGLYSNSFHEKQVPAYS